MDQLPRSNDGFANNNMFADSQQYNAYDNLFQPGADQNSYDASWGLNASAYPGQSRVPPTPTQAWPSNANHLSSAATHAGLNGQASPYGRSLSPAGYGQTHFNNFGAQQNFQYRQPQYDPTLVPPNPYPHGFNYAAPNYQTPNPGTIAPQALEHETRPPTLNRSPYAAAPAVDYPMANTNQPRPMKSYVAETVDQRALAGVIPNGRPAGYFSIINFDDLAKGTKSERMGNFVNIGTEPQHWDVNRAALPAYLPRKSRSELRKIVGNDQRALSKIGKKSVKKEKSQASAAKQLQLASSAVSLSPEKVKYDGDSSSQEESSSDEDSDTSYTSDDEPTEPSPLTVKRPTSPREATEYDATKAVWRGKRKNLSSDSIRKGIVDFWEIIKTIRDRWKADAKAVEEAEEKKQDNELPLLESRVKDQRDMMESAFKAALKHGHRSIVELLSENAPLLYLCYQFLLDRHKADDYNGPLSRVILETMTIFKTLTDQKLEKTHLVKIFPRFAKKGDAKTQGYTKKILANAAAGSETQPAEPPKKDPAKSDSLSSPTGKRAEPAPVAGIKRAASTAGDGGTQKKLATTTNKAGSTLSSIKQSAANAATKKASSVSDKTTTAAPTITKSKPVTAKPSGMFSSLQSASKKPGTSAASKVGQLGIGTKPTDKSTAAAAPTAAPKSTFSFAETMAAISKPKEEKVTPKPENVAPKETPEEKAKRLKKESRRNLHVQFKAGDDLVQVRIFHHDPEEELGHDASQMRDVADVGGEGRMFKQQHQMMDIDDDEDAAEEEEKLMQFKAPGLIDFSDVDEEERKRNYAPFGGGKIAPESSERAIRDYYEANNLIVFYSDPSDVPPNPREPSDPANGEKVAVAKDFAKPDEKWAVRGRQRKAGSSSHPYEAQQAFNTNTANLAPGLDLSKILGNPSQPSNAFQQPQQPSMASNNAIQDILANLNKAGMNAAATPPMMGHNSYAPPQPPVMNFQAPQPAALSGGPIDLAAILAQLQGQPQNSAAQAPPMGGYNYNVANAMPNMTGYSAPPQPSAAYENPERKQWREGDSAESNRKRQPTAQNPYYKTKVCKYWLENKCQKGDNCTYKHET